MGLLDGIKKGIAEGGLLNAHRRMGLLESLLLNSHGINKNILKGIAKSDLLKKDLYSSSNQAFLKQNEISRGMSRNRSVFSKLGEDSNSYNTFKKKLLGE